MGSMLLEVKLINHQTGERCWRLQQSVASLEEGLRVASNMASCYDFRLFVSPEIGYLYLDWVDNPDNETCSPVWKNSVDNQSTLY